ncbi:MAG: carboxypeptidase M32, partial [Myxococcota bacterium]|nr:carboxypeptidase M32 [Myxococcota bacterium]
MDAAWARLQTRWTELEALRGVLSLLEWDHQTMMPSQGSPARGLQLSVMSAMVHDRVTDPQVGEDLDLLESSTDPMRQASARLLRRDHERAVKVPRDLVQALARARNDGFVAWERAREAADFSLFEPALKELVGLCREQVSCLGPSEHPYDLLLDEYDPGITTAQLRPLFERLRDALVPFVDELVQRTSPPPLETPCPYEVQDRVGRVVIEAMGFDMERGRLDLSTHPFTVGLHPSDVRITSHKAGSDLLGVLSGTTHEAGHGLYEQGLREDWSGTGLASAASLGLHESQ